MPIKTAVQCGYSQAFHCPSRQICPCLWVTDCTAENPQRGQTWTSEAKWKPNHQEYQVSAEWTDASKSSLDDQSVCFKGGNKKFIYCLKVFFFIRWIHEIRAAKKQCFKLQINYSARLPSGDGCGPRHPWKLFGHAWWPVCREGAGKGQ